MTASRRMLLVHAHPDDESIGTGATMAKYAAEGVGVTLLTCTLGEEGEILVPELAQLEAARADQLGGIRIGELASAMRRLGVRDHRFLGGAGRFRDSGMMGVPSNSNPRAFWAASRDQAAFDAGVIALVDVIRDVRPQVVITYDDFGGYGHPDHIMAHRVCTEAVAVSGGHHPGSARPPWTVEKLYWTATPRSVLWDQVTAMQAANSGFASVDPSEDLGYAVEDEIVTTAVDARAFLPAKMAAMAEHATQITVDGPFFALSNNIGLPAGGVEYFRLIKGELGTERDANGRETDLFAGLPA